VPDEVRAAVLGCRDLERLERWLVRAVTCTRAEDVIGED